MTQYTRRDPYPHYTSMPKDNHESRRSHIKQYATDNGFALALPAVSTGRHTIGWNNAGGMTRGFILDKAIETIEEFKRD